MMRIHPEGRTVDVTEVVETDKVEKLSKENADLQERVAMMEDALQRLLEKDKEKLKNIIKKVLKIEEDRR